MNKIIDTGVILIFIVILILFMIKDVYRDAKINELESRIDSIKIEYSNLIKDTIKNER